MTQTGDSSFRRTPSNPKDSMSSTPSALTEVPRVGVTAEAGEIAFCEV
jgi:hypothetical protein